VAQSSILINPSDRIAIVGKTGSGKSQLAIVLAGTYARILPEPWEVWWIDTKADSKDIEALRGWGFRNALDAKDRLTSPIMNAVYFRCASKGTSGMTIRHQAQLVLDMAYQRRNVYVIVDEFGRVVNSRTSSGESLDKVFFQGRGLNIGFIGCTQEPVNIPRNLISQAQHQCLMRLTYRLDIKTIHDLYPWYEPPNRYAFYWIDVDGTEQVRFYDNQASFYDDLLVLEPEN
jgi:energy-coupling factor transporter ATP-binding protein EcfA2